MMAVIFAMPGNEAITSSLARISLSEAGSLETRSFPDGETYLRFQSPVQGRSTMLVCSLHEPNLRILPLLFAADALKDLGATSVGLVAPYLAYMRQDNRFRDGEAITSVAFAKLISRAFDWIATIDPHLHRYRSMSEIYSIPTVMGHAGRLLADYLLGKKDGVFLIGPDEESEQWVSAVAASAGVPHLTMKKTRHGDRDVSIDFSNLETFRGLRPVLVDDMISTGHTMEVAVRHLVGLGFAEPVCLAVHGILAENAMSRLKAAGAEVVSTNSIPNPSSAIDVAPLLAELVSPCIHI